ncbi:hypothetical protein PC116_g361 [Phytophthora cactorum]|nr:hypothetical protein Pcac1_g247 [Phytophthora cactorum]KAG3036275.1 hypothetical protein PC120_g362 [Phytophthora cactorum]KAG3192820.1 hypothetical protein C6341_g457 [Phytophthora cactorum]KAG3207355.1 hypothetical protein PC128_g35 [Phytophthora cactorum]KAG4251853.1 hypothetical protein PC116_g361 [Phytophthora cactorum]
MRARISPDSASTAELAEFFEFLLQIGEDPYPVNGEIGKSGICLPRDMCVLPEPALALDEETKEHEETRTWCHHQISIVFLRWMSRTPET